MTPLRQRMLEDISPHTRDTYVEQVARFARHFGQRVDEGKATARRAYTGGMTRFLFVLLAIPAIAWADQLPAPSPGDAAAVRAVIQRYVDARELRDPAAIEALFTADADQHTTAGEWRRGRDRIVAGTLEASQRNPGTRRITVEAVRFLTPDVAVADGPYEIGGTNRTTWTTIVVIRDAGTWRIAAIRNMVPTGAQAGTTQR